MLPQNLIKNSRKRGGVLWVLWVSWGSVGAWRHTPPEGDIQPPKPGEGVVQVAEKIKKTI